MSPETLSLIFGFLVLPIACIILERRRPQVRGYRTLRVDFAADAVWYFVQSLVSHVIAPWIVFFAVLPIFLAGGLPLEGYWSGFGPASRLPFWLQTVIVFVVGDFLSYWQHRLFHTKTAWPIHAVHHSSTSLDWLSATRFHPLNEIVAQLIFVTPLIATGFSPMSFVVLAPFTATYAVILHANVNWEFGPLRYLVASPVFHRWHHTQAAEAQNKNFAGFLPLWDLLFGTLYLPRDQRPSVFGVSDPVPDGFWPQLHYPFQAASKRPPASGSPGQ